MKVPESRVDCELCAQLLQRLQRESPSDAVNGLAKSLYDEGRFAGATLQLIQHEIGKLYREYLRDQRRGWSWSMKRARVPLSEQFSAADFLAASR